MNSKAPSRKIDLAIHGNTVFESKKLLEYQSGKLVDQPAKSVKSTTTGCDNNVMLTMCDNKYKDAATTTNSFITQQQHCRQHRQLCCATNNQKQTPSELDNNNFERKELCMSGTLNRENDEEAKNKGNGHSKRGRKRKVRNSINPDEQCEQTCSIPELIPPPNTDTIMNNKKKQDVASAHLPKKRRKGPLKVRGADIVHTFF